MKNVDVLKAFARRFEVTWDKGRFEEARDLYEAGGGDGVPYALCARPGRTIYLNDDMITTPESAIEALVHEGGEGMLDFLGVEVKHCVYEGIVALLVNMMIESGIIDPDEFVVAGRKLADMNTAQRKRQKSS